MLLVSGGHSLLLRADGVGSFQQLGTTTDDAPGEALDKVARALGVVDGGRGLERLSSDIASTAGKWFTPNTHQKRDVSILALAGSKNTLIPIAKVLPLRLPCI